MHIDSSSNYKYNSSYKHNHGNRTEAWINFDIPEPLLQEAEELLRHQEALDEAADVRNIWLTFPNARSQFVVK